jgi:hypothetical protein
VANIQCFDQTQLAGCQALPQRDARDELCRDEPGAAGFADVVDRDDIQVIQGGSGFGLSPEQSDPPGIVCELRWQDFQCDVPIKPAIAGPMDHAHRAGADLGQNFVVTQSESYHRGSRLGSDIRQMIVQFLG